MKRVHIDYACDVCGKEIGEALTVTDGVGRNYGLCPDCRKRGYSLTRQTVVGGPGVMIAIAHPEPGQLVHNVESSGAEKQDSKVKGFGDATAKQAHK